MTVVMIDVIPMNSTLGPPDKKLLRIVDSFSGVLKKRKPDEMSYGHFFSIITTKKT